MTGTATLEKAEQDEFRNMPASSMEYLLLTLFHESFRDAVKIGEKKAAHFRGNVGGAGVKNDRPDGKKHERKWHPERKLKEATEDLNKHLEKPIFKRTVEILGRDPESTVRRFRKIMNGENLEDAKKALNLLKKQRQRMAQSGDDRKNEQEESIREADAGTGRRQPDSE